MNKLLSIAVLILMATSCVKIQVGSGKSIKGSGKVERKELQISDVHRVVISGIGELTINSGAQESCVLETDDNLIPEIDMRQDGDRLVLGIKTNENLMPTKGIKFHITLKSLGELRASGAAEVMADVAFESDTKLVSSEQQLLKSIN